jgi:hypothetical protein
MGVARQSFMSSSAGPVMAFLPMEDLRAELEIRLGAGTVLVESANVGKEVS